MLLSVIFIPIISGILLPFINFKKSRYREIYIEFFVCLTSIIVWYMIIANYSGEKLVFNMTDELDISLHFDGLSKFFAGIVSFLWPLATLYAYEYMEHKNSKNTFFAFYTMTFGVTLGIALAQNILTLYIFYEFLTLVTLPLVMHGMAKRSINAGLTYLYYSLGGAAMAFIGMMIVLQYGNGNGFTMGGIMNVTTQNHDLLLFGYILCFFGFGVKAAVFPFHGWLPIVHVAPTPVTALLHAVAVVKAGVFSIIRVTYYCYGTDLLRDTYAQYIPLAFACFTILFGSVYALKEQHLKRRLAYSTVSNLSYILFGVLLMTPLGLSAGLMHMLYHAIIKIILFFTAGAILLMTGREYIQDIRGFSKIMPFIFTVFAVAALALTGVPPFSGFISKWALSQAAIAEGSLLGTIGIFILLTSAVLTAAYSIEPAISAFVLPLNSNCCLENKNYDPGWKMKLSLTLCLSAMLALSFFGSQLADFLNKISTGLI